MSKFKDGIVDILDKAGVAVNNYALAETLYEYFMAAHTVVSDEDGNVVSVELTDDECQILEVLWES